MLTSDTLCFLGPLKNQTSYRLAIPIKYLSRGQINFAHVSCSVGLNLGLNWVISIITKIILTITAILVSESTLQV